QTPRGLPPDQFPRHTIFVRPGSDSAVKPGPPAIARQERLPSNHAPSFRKRVAAQRPGFSNPLGRTCTKQRWCADPTVATRTQKGTDPLQWLSTLLAETRCLFGATSVLPIASTQAPIWNASPHHRTAVQPEQTFFRYFPRKV